MNRRPRSTKRALLALALLCAGLIASACAPVAPSPASACDVIPLDTGQTLVECPESTSLRINVESSDGFGLTVLAITETEGMTTVDDFSVVSSVAGCDPVEGTNSAGPFVAFPCGGAASVTLNTGSGTLVGVGPPPGGTARVTAVL